MPCYPERIIEDFNERIDRLKREYHAYVAKLRELDPECGAVPWTDRPYDVGSRKRKLTSPAAGDVTHHSSIRRHIQHDTLFFAALLYDICFRNRSFKYQCFGLDDETVSAKISTPATDKRHRIKLPILTSPNENVYKFNDGLIQADVTWKLQSSADTDRGDDTADNNSDQQVSAAGGGNGQTDSVHDRLLAMGSNAFSATGASESIQGPSDAAAAAVQLWSDVTEHDSAVGENNAPLTFNLSGSVRLHDGATRDTSSAGAPGTSSTGARVTPCTGNPAHSAREARVAVDERHQLRRCSENTCHKNLLGLDYDDSSGSE